MRRIGGTDRIICKTRISGVNRIICRRRISRVDRIVYRTRIRGAVWIMSINEFNHAPILVKGTLCLDYLTLRS